MRNKFSVLNSQFSVLNSHPRTQTKNFGFRISNFEFSARGDGKRYWGVTPAIGRRRLADAELELGVPRGSQGWVSGPGTAEPQLGKRLGLECGEILPIRARSPYLKTQN